MKRLMTRLMIAIMLSILVFWVGESFGQPINRVEAIIVYEKTSFVAPFPFTVCDTRLIEEIAMLGPDAFDFGSSAGVTEYYDVYVSDGDGTPNPDGMYLTIDCFHDSSGTGSGAGHNIDAVALHYTNGTIGWATEVTASELGLDQSETAAELENILGEPDGNPTYVGDQSSGITVGFGLTESMITEFEAPDDQAPFGSVHAYPNIIRPRIKRYVEVTIEGYLFDESGIDSAWIEYDGNTTSLTAAIGNYSTSILLKAEKGSSFIVELHASDTEGNGPVIVDSTVITVP